MGAIMHNVGRILCMIVSRDQEKVILFCQAVSFFEQNKQFIF